jgi:ribosomal protein S18 acetylase RimI-like enzyme
MVRYNEGTYHTRKGKRMAKIQPPKGYITATEVKSRLNISDAMIRYYVQKEKIKYLVPPGRKQGFYRERDVNNLSNELNAFLHMEDEEKATLVTAEEEDLLEIANIANDVFSFGTPPSEVAIPKWRYMLLRKNKEAQYVLKQGDTVIGFATILPLRIDTNKVEKLFNSETVSQAQITEDDIETFEPGKHVRLYIGAIATDPKLEKHRRKKHGATLIRELINRVVELGERGVVIKDITAIGASQSGIHILLSFGLHEIPARKPKNRAFIMNIEESGAPVSMQYKQALKEYQERRKENNILSNPAY